MSEQLYCPQCGLSGKGTPVEGDTYPCPRCLARTSGALSVALVPRASTNGPSPGLAAQLVQSLRRIGARATLLPR